MRQHSLHGISGMGGVMFGDLPLAEAIASSFTGAMGTSLWGAVHAKVARVFQRDQGDEPATLLAELENNARLVASAEDAAAARQQLAPYWQFRFQALLREDPQIESELRDLVAELAPQLAQVHGAQVQTNNAYEGSSVFAAQGGNVIVHQAPPPPPEEESGR
ncbi:hypothetical protein [Streptomyces iconiensis]|uniref:Uncharacterized protein n=1 Tax=Streptomyces iconiensis TaxID=1384038 RepID=A0ABT7A1M5_9ACTN|nr:hypothetical protein [Streptomyces iconiensis]MDJ1134518.1 hypothetical protein [Streptomyces iconiensis]